MLNKIFKVNRKENVNIWVRKSIVKFRKSKTILIETKTPEQHFFIFKDRKHYDLLKLNPVSVFDLFTESQRIKELVNKDGYFYFNGKKTTV